MDWKNQLAEIEKESAARQCDLLDRGERESRQLRKCAFCALGDVTQRAEDSAHYEKRDFLGESFSAVEKIDGQHRQRKRDCHPFRQKREQEKNKRDSQPAA